MKPALAVAVLTSFLARPLAAQAVSVTEANLLAYFTEQESSPQLVGTLQHFSTWKYGSNFFFVDISGGSDMELSDSDLGLYLEYSPVLSLRKVGLVPAWDGALRDVGVTAQINGGWTHFGAPVNRAILGGTELAWAVPGFALFNTQLLARKELHYDLTWQFTWAYEIPLRVWGARGQIGGFMDVWQSRGQGGSSTVVLAQPQLLFTLGTPEPGDSFVQLGVEFEPSHDFPSPAARPGWNLGVSPIARWVF